ncbi:hypothetical protein GCM10027168_11630 [Streptomyces capparidis]
MAPDRVPLHGALEDAQTGRQTPGPVAGALTDAMLKVLWPDQSEKGWEDMKDKVAELVGQVLPPPAPLHSSRIDRGAVSPPGEGCLICVHRSPVQPAGHERTQRAAHSPAPAARPGPGGPGAGGAGGLHPVVPKTARAQVRFLLGRARASTKALAARLGVSQRTVQRYPLRDHPHAPPGRAPGPRGGGRLAVAAAGARPSAERAGCDRAGDLHPGPVRLHLLPRLHRRSRGMGEHDEDRGDVAAPARPPLDAARARAMTAGLREAMDDVRRSVAVLACDVPVSCQ